MSGPIRGPARTSAEDGPFASSDRRSEQTMRRNVSLLRSIILNSLATVLASGASAQVARVTTSDHNLLKDARTVFIESGYLPGDGLVVIRSIRNGQMQAVPLGRSGRKAACSLSNVGSSPTGLRPLQS